jgi:protein PhnA
MLYLDASLLAWAEAGVQEESERNSTPTKDSNGVTLKAGDTVTITKDLKVKGTSIVAKQGTAVRGISLTDNPEHIEGRVNGTRIVILTCFVKKS